MNSEKASLRQSTIAPWSWCLLAIGSCNVPAPSLGEQCPEGNQPPQAIGPANGEPVHGAVLASTSGPMSLWQGTDPSSLWRDIANPPDPFADGLAGARTVSPADLPAPLADIWQAHRAASGVTEIAFSYTRRSPAPLGVAIATSLFEGRIAADGRLTLVERFAATVRSTGESRPVVVDHHFSGGAYYKGLRGGETYMAWAPRSAGGETALRASLPAAFQLVEWLRSPFGIPLTPGVEYASAWATLPVGILHAAPRPVLQITQTRGDADERVVWFVDADQVPMRVLRSEWYGSDDRLFFKAEFGDYRSLSSGLDRPFRVIETEIGTSGAEITGDLTVTAAVAWTGPEPLPVPRFTAATDWWTVFPPQ